MKLSKGNLIAIFVILMLIIDQIIKVIVKLNMTIGESISVFGNWFQILFIENNGMAFGMQLGGIAGKLLLSGFRLVLIAVIIWYIIKLLKEDSLYKNKLDSTATNKGFLFKNLIPRKVPNGVLVGISLVLIGAIGNIVDSAFYGLIFSESDYTNVATLFPSNGGYAAFLCGKVVDMFYFPIINTTLPDWVPFWGGEEFVFFRPIFNFADSCVSVGVIYLLLFHRKFFGEHNTDKHKETASNVS